MQFRGASREGPDQRQVEPVDVLGKCSSRAPVFEETHQVVDGVVPSVALVHDKRLQQGDITNTPWKQRHAYVLPVEDAQVHGRALHWNFAKRFHVSPFMPMDCTYDWRFTVPGEDLRVHMNVMREGRRTFDATLNLQRLPLTGASLARVLWRYPLMTAQVVGAIHWHALRLWLKRNPVHDHPAGASRHAD